MPQINLQHQFNSGQVLEIIQGDITLVKTDALVNAANSQLMHGGGVAAAISRKGGETIEQESRSWIAKYGPVTHSKPAVTSGGYLPCRFVIHAVGPVWGEGDEDQKLSDAIMGSMKKAEILNATSITFPAISTGIFGFPKDRAADIFLQAIQEYFLRNPSSQLRNVKIVIMEIQTLSAFSSSFSKTFGGDKKK